MSRLVFILAVGVFTLLPPTFAETPEKKTEGAASTIFVDPVTHQRRQPEPGEIDKLHQANRSAAARRGAPATPVILRGPGTAVGIVHNEDELTETVATRRPDGTLSVECVPAGRAGKKSTGNHADEK
jgi:hypothetical protein